MLDTKKAKLLEQLGRLPLDAELGKIVTKGLMNLPDEEADRLTWELKEALDNLPDALKQLKG